ncbi:MAG: GTP 3',8-cyclase MoaA [Pseudobutyrivibrio sp.]|nr:GTP 3',8-cyclase MoaA [Pseudobutyrivibrio sp.]
MARVVDLYGRNIDYMRISITDRCNLRCKYCMPNGIQSVAMEELLSFEEIISCVKAAAKLGIKYIKVTGGEPLVRRGCSNLIKMLKAVDGIEKVTLTTNGVLLQQHIDSLIDAKVDGINISLDTLDRNSYFRITGFDELQVVLRGIDVACENGIKTKINVVALEEKPLEEYRNLVELTLKKDIDVRFIEMMPIGMGRMFSPVSSQKLLAQFREMFSELEIDYTNHGFGPAVYYKVPGALGSIGFISAIHGKFCDCCNRIRLSSMGFLKSCLCYDTGVDLREILRDMNDDATRDRLLQEAIRDAILGKPKEHCFDRPLNITEEKYMASIGG